jgi:hypothetical protein
MGYSKMSRAGSVARSSLVAHAVIAAGVIGAVAFAQRGGEDGGRSGGDRWGDASSREAAPPDGITGEMLIDAPDMSDPQAMQEMMSEYSSMNEPSKGHDVLKRYAGEWDVVQRTMMPGMPEMTSNGTARSRLAMGGKYLMSEFKGSFMGQPFEGLSVMGYDNFAKQFFSFWVDSMGTAPYLSKGGLSEDGRVIALVGEMNEPLTGELGKSAKWVMTWIDEDTYRLEAQEIVYGEPKTVMSLEYRRKD